MCLCRPSWAGGWLAVVTDFWRNGRLTHIVSDEIVREYLEVLRRPKLGLSTAHVDAVAAFLLQRAEFVTPMLTLAVVVADPDDNKFVEAAVAGQAEYIVSGDHHLLELGEYQAIPIVTARAFIERLEVDPPAA